MRKNITRDEWATLVLLLAIGLGAFVRFNPTMLAGYAINDGGMFTVLIEDLISNKYRLPSFTSYNDVGIPFAYPPLGFYLGGFAGSLFGFETVETVRWLPAFFASLSIPAFYLLALRLLGDRYRASLSALIYSFMPRAFSWLVMGGGLTRAPGQFFMLLALVFIVRLYQEGRRNDILFSSMFAGFAVLSHPASAVQTLTSALFLWLTISRTRDAFIRSVFVGILVVVFTLPWWLSVVQVHGVDVLLNAARTGGKSTAVFNLLFFTFSDELYATLIAVLGLIGLAYCLLRRDILLPLWLAFPFVVAGRGAANLAVVPLAMLAALGLTEVILKVLKPAQPTVAEVTPTERNVFLYLILYLIFSTVQFSAQLSSATLYSPDEQAMRWIRQNTPEDSQFVVLTGTTSVSCDSVLEWFPAISGRKSLFTVQGTEWTKGAEFNDYVRSTYAVQECLSKSDIACLDGVVDRADYEYIYVSKLLRVNNCSPLAPQMEFPYFVESLRSSAGFEVVYESNGVLISRQK